MKDTQPRNLERERTERALARAPSNSDIPGLARAVQEKLGYLPATAIDSIAKRAALERAVVQELIEQQDELLLSPPGRHQVTICSGRTCARRGGARLIRMAREKLSLEVFQTTPDSAVRLEPFRCFGQCAQGPNVRLDGSLRGAMTEKRFALLLDLFLRPAD
ncbi:MAG: NAD(P)H-dependent oxidoreductase subunit E [Myxococcota bacterium]